MSGGVDPSKSGLLFFLSTPLLTDSKTSENIDFAKLKLRLKSDLRRRRAMSKLTSQWFVPRLRIPHMTELMVRCILPLLIAISFHICSLTVMSSVVSLDEHLPE